MCALLILVWDSMMGFGCCLTPCQFTGCSFGAAAILQYETLKSRVQSAQDEEESENLLQVRF